MCGKKTAGRFIVRHHLGRELRSDTLIDSEMVMAHKTTSVALAVELTAAWLANPSTRANADDVPEFLRLMCRAISQLAGTPTSAPPEDPEQVFEPAVTVRKSLASPDQIISLINGKPYKTLRRHLANHGLTPVEYRIRYNLEPNYPMVAPSYSDARRAMAKSIGLGRQAKKKVHNSSQSTLKNPRSSKTPNISGKK